MNTKRRNIICYLFVVLMLFSGMCLDEIQTDSVVLIDTTISQVPVVEALDGNLLTHAICTPEMLGVRNVSSMAKGGRRSIGRAEIRASVHAICGDVLSRFVSHCYTTSHVIQLPELCSGIIVSHYIHNQDGKK